MNTYKPYILCTIILALLTGSSCQSYQERVKTERQAALDFLKNDSNSPIPPDERKNFTAENNYFPIDPAHNIDAQYNRLSNQKPVTMATSDGKQRKFVPYGKFTFTLRGQEMSLIAYEPIGTNNDGRLFIPFYDASNGSETYGGGRYLNVPKPRTAETKLDFNLTYNPYCAYNDGYSCPVPPKENTLPVKILAGEKAYKTE